MNSKVETFIEGFSIAIICLMVITIIVGLGIALFGETKDFLYAFILVFGVGTMGGLVALWHEARF